MSSWPKHSKCYINRKQLENALSLIRNLNKTLCSVGLGLYDAFHCVVVWIWTSFSLNVTWLCCCVHCRKGDSFGKQGAKGRKWWVLGVHALRAANHTQQQLRRETVSRPDIENLFSKPFHEGFAPIHRDRRYYLGDLLRCAS